MSEAFKGKIIANGTEISILSKGNDEDFISLTDIAKYKNSEYPADVIKNWLRTRFTLDFLGTWEQLNNPVFKLVEFDQFKNAAGTNAFVLSPQKWIAKTNAIGIRSTSGRYGGGTFAHKDIAFEFASWISPEFKLYIIKEYQRLKAAENSRISIDWNVKRILAKVNYKIHTNAIRDNLIPSELTARQRSFIYADEADLLNTALFGMTAAEWRMSNPNEKGNMRDNATIEQLLVLANLENINALYIGKNMPQSERITELNSLARSQLAAIIGTNGVKRLHTLNSDSND